MNIDQEIADLRSRLKDAEKRRQQEMDEKKKSVKPIYRFTLTPSKIKPYHEILDDSIVLFRLEGIVENAEEMREVGADPFQGGMDYYFNTLSGKIVTSTGGGNVWISTDSVFSRQEGEREHARLTFNLLSRFLVKNPEGGDVTEIVQNHRDKFSR
jgi:hypothetical protein